ncbi:MAG: bifunctional 5,10-methylenetetrahydrofolate dehydrogenase/5,10-methenyltetrahydrofolate cyclohydrolase, partial [Pseudobdellovibrionaceae bacterium]
DGKAISAKRRAAIAERVTALKARGISPGLAVVIVGEDPASEVYVRNKVKACESLGMQSTKLELPESLPQQALEDTIRKLNETDNVDGILVQLPLPKGLKEEPILEILSPEKDADGFTFQSLGHLWGGKPFVAPCTPSGVMSILAHYHINPAGMRCVVVGRSNIVGKPMAHLLTTADATVTLCHSKTKDLSSYTRQADLVVVAAGKRHMLGREDFKQGAVVIDVGMHGSGEGGKVTGDVRISELEDWVRAVTPVPGGVGPMTITTLLENTVTLAEKRLKL